MKFKITKYIAMSEQNMSRYDITMDYISKFTQCNGNVWKNSIKPTFISINENEAKKSSFPYSLEKAEIGLVIIHYTYTVIEKDDQCIVPIFFHPNGDVEDFVEIDGWRFSFSKPKTALYRCDGRIACYMTNGKLQLNVTSYTSCIDSEFEKIWHLFSIIRTCETQKEIDYAYKIFKNEQEIISLKNRCLQDDLKIDSLNTLLEAHKDFIEKLKSIMNSKLE